MFPTPKTHDVGSIYNCKHDGDNVEFPELGLEVENNVRIEQPPDDADDIPHYDTNDCDYIDLILNHDHFEKGESFKGKFISYHDENLALINQTLCDVIREAYTR